MINRRHLIATGAAAAMAGCGQVERPLYSADAHVADYPTVQGVQAMARMVEERTGGRQRVKIFAGAQLGSERDTLELTIFGALDLNRVNLAPLNAFASETIIPSLPFLFNSVEHMRTSLDGAPGQAILDALRSHGLVGLCFYDSGARSFYNTRGPVHAPEDLQGLKIRVQNSDLYVAMVQALGANPTPMSFTEVYQGLVQGVIDGAENNMPSYESTRHFEAARYYSYSRHVMAPEILVMSKHRWDRLSGEDQAIFQQAARDSVPVMRELWDARVNNARDRVLASGVETNEIADIGAFSDRMESVWDRFVASDVQRRLVEDIRNLGGQV